jgi:hypothetical protein
MKPIELVPATNELLVRFYGEPVKRTMRAVVAVRGNEILGVAGIYRHENGWGMFSDTTEELRRHGKLLLKSAKAFMQVAIDSGLPIFAKCSENLETADRFLRHLGFRPVDGDLYQWQAQESR